MPIIFRGFLKLQHFVVVVVELARVLLLENQDELGGKLEYYVGRVNKESRTAEFESLSDVAADISDSTSRGPPLAGISDTRLSKVSLKDGVIAIEIRNRIAFAAFARRASK